MVPYSEESIGHLRENSSLWEEIWKLAYNILLRISISHTTDYDHKMIADYTKMRFQKKIFFESNTSSPTHQMTMNITELQREFVE